jgi:hypothetical protein
VGRYERWHLRSPQQQKANRKAPKRRRPNRFGPGQARHLGCRAVIRENVAYRRHRRLPADEQRSCWKNGQRSPRPRPVVATMKTRIAARGMCQLSNLIRHCIPPFRWSETNAVTRRKARLTLPKSSRMKARNSHSSVDRTSLVDALCHRAVSNSTARLRTWLVAATDDSENGLCRRT